MGDVNITLVIKDYDYLAPLVCGDVVAEGINLTLDRVSPITRTVLDPAVTAGELSFSHHLIRMSRGEAAFVGIPVFAYRAFRHRCFFVRRNSDLRRLTDLDGRRVGTNSYPDSGNTWSRAALREAGVRIDRMTWVYGPIEDASAVGSAGRPQIPLPENVRPAPPGRALRDMLLDGDLDALMIPTPPQGFYASDSPVRRLVPDYRAAERSYYLRTGLYPAHHIIGLRREVFERSPWVAFTLYAAIERAKLAWQKSRGDLAETTPWLLAEIEEAVALFGEDWQPNGLTETNRGMVKALCEEELAQGLIQRPLDDAGVFAEFERAATA